MQMRLIFLGAKNASAYVYNVFEILSRQLIEQLCNNLNSILFIFMYKSIQDSSLTLKPLEHNTLT